MTIEVIFTDKDNSILESVKLGKELHGMRRTRLMGRWKVQIQLWLIASVINLKRAIKALTNRSDGRELSNQQGNLSFPIAITTITRILATLMAN